MEYGKITDLDIQALVDGEIIGDRKQALMDSLTCHPDLYKRFLLYQKQKNLLKSWWKDN